MKAALAQFIFESNTFTPGLAEIDLFRKGGVFLEDEARVRAWAAGTDSQMHGSLEMLAAAGWETAPCFTALCGSPAGRLSAACLRQISSTLLDRVAAAMPFDVLILHLHGAAAADGEDDPEGYLLEKVRTDLGYAAGSCSPSTCTPTSPAACCGTPTRSPRTEPSPTWTSPPPASAPRA